MTTRLRQVKEGWQRGWQQGLERGKYEEPGPLLVALIGAGLTTLGWNFGVTEAVEALGGPDGNINYLEGGALFIALMIVGRAIHGAE